METTKSLPTKFVGVTLEQRIAGWRYAKNGCGDAHGRGTARHLWVVVAPNGRPVFSNNSKSACVEILNDLAAELGWTAK